MVIPGGDLEAHALARELQLGLNAANHITALLKKYGEADVATQALVGQLTDRLVLEVRDLSQGDLQILDLVQLEHLSLDADGFFEEDVESILADLEHFQLGPLLEALPTDPSQVEAGAKGKEQLFEGGQGFHEVGEHLEPTVGPEEATGGGVER